MAASGLTETWQGTRHFRPLDGIRAVAVTMVFAGHFGAVGGRFSRTWWGWTGVDLFFVLSGLLITGILYDAPREQGYFATFYKRRALRIFPLYFAFWAAVLAVRFALTVKWPVADLAWIAYLGNFLPIVAVHRGVSPDYYTNLWLHSSVLAGYQPTIVIGHFWSLCVEEQFYLVWPVVIWFCRSRRALMRWCVAGIVGALVLRIVLEAVLPAPARHSELIYKLSFTRVDSLLMGAWLALYLRRESVMPVRHALYLYCAGLGSLILFVGSAIYFPAKLLGHLGEGWLNTYGLSLPGAVSLAVLVAVIRIRPLQQVLMWRPLMALGKVSYGFYVFHLLLIGLFPGQIVRSRHPIVLGVVFFAAVWALSWLSFRFLETPFLRLKSRWAPAREEPVVMFLPRAEPETFRSTSRAA
jgi:peptidoglycan/LPS O-acetylase OafA/YrhL